MTDSARLRRWQTVTAGSLFVGYAGYYVCRSVLPVASNGMLNDPALQAAGFDEVAYGRLGAAGIYAYAAGKLVNGVATEYLGGRAAFLAGMVLSAVLVAAFGLVGGVGLFLGLWAANRFVQSMGWTGLVNITVRWFRPESLATVMGWLSLSYLFGDFLARLYLGAVWSAGVAWPTLFLVAAGTLGVIAATGAVLLRGRPRDVGLPEPPPPPANVHGTTAAEDRLSLGRLLGPLFASRMFWLVCLMNAGLTSVRETFNFWTPRYLEKGVGLDPQYTGLLSAVFPLAGAVASVAAGWAADRSGRRYGRLMVPLMVATVVALGVIATADLSDRPYLALTLIAGVAVTLMGPYTFCSGVLAMNLGGQRAGAASAGIIDAAGYLCGAVVSGEIAGRLVKAYGFAPLLDVLFWLGVGTLAVGVVYWRLEERSRR